MSAPQTISLGLGSPSSIGWLLTLGLGDVGSSFHVYHGLTRSIDPAAWPGTVTVELEIQGFTSNAGLPYHAHLYNVTDDEVVAGSEVSTIATSVTRLRSSSFSLPAGAKVFEVRYGGAGGGAFTTEDAVLLLTIV